MMSGRQKIFANTSALLLIISSAALAQAQTIEPPSSPYAPDGYHIETIPTPPNLPFHIAGLDVNKNDEVFVATRFGDVWKYSGDQWFLFASGLHEPTGLLCDDDGSILVAQKPELTRLVDTNGDGVAEDYIHISSEWTFHDNYHEFNFGPVKDREGNYFGTLNLSHNLKDAFGLGTMTSASGYRGFAYRINSEGEFTPWAWGLRSPAGIGASPKGEIFYTDNQGDWVGTSKLHLVRKGEFYGHPVSLRDVEGYTLDWIRNATPEEFNAFRTPPNVWIPHIEVANSPGNPTWDTTRGKFGPFKGQIFIADQTQSNLFRVLLDEVDGDYQGAVINFMDSFQSGNIRTAFDSKGQLWVGQTSRGWASKGGKPYGLQKVHWDGTRPFELLDITLTKTGFKLKFTERLDKGSVNLDSVSAVQWHYHYHGEYGSPKVDEAPVPINDVRLSWGRKTIKIDMPLTAGKVIMITFDGVRDRSGRAPSTHTVYYTLNRLR